MPNPKRSTWAYSKCLTRSKTSLSLSMLWWAHKLLHSHGVDGSWETKSCLRSWRTLKLLVTCKTSTFWSNIWHFSAIKRKRRSISCSFWSTSQFRSTHQIYSVISYASSQRKKLCLKKLLRRKGSIIASLQNYWSELALRFPMIAYRPCKNYSSRWAKDRKSFPEPKSSCASLKY